MSNPKKIRLIDGHWFKFYQGISHKSLAEEMRSRLKKRFKYVRIIKSRAEDEPMYRVYVSGKYRL